MGNQIRTAFLLAVMTVFIVFIGNLLGGRQGMILAFFLAAAMNLFSYWFSDKMVLKMYRAQELSPKEAPELYTLVKGLTQKAGLPMPRVYIIPQDSPNAFATGRNPEHAVIAVTQGLLRILNQEELKGVLAHELAHVKNRDILIGTIAATMAGAVMILASMARWSAFFGGSGRNDEEGRGGLGFIGVMVVSILAPIAAMVIQMAVSRSREYLADSTGSTFAGHPEGLAGALEKLGAYSSRVPMEANPQTAHMFIVNPLTGKSLMNLFSTHPPLEDRIAKLRGKENSRNTPSAGSPTLESRGKNMWDHLSK
jgi:heat shock protein HtpX